MIEPDTTATAAPLTTATITFTPRKILFTLDGEGIGVQALIGVDNPQNAPDAPYPGWYEKRWPDGATMADICASGFDSLQGWKMCARPR